MYHSTVTHNLPKLTSLEFDLKTTPWDMNIRPHDPSLLDNSLITTITTMKDTLVSLRLTAIHETDFVVIMNSVDVLHHLRDFYISFCLPLHGELERAGTHLSSFLVRHKNTLETLTIRRESARLGVYEVDWIRDDFPKLDFPSLRSLTLRQGKKTIQSIGTRNPSALDLAHFPVLEQLLVFDSSITVPLPSLFSISSEDVHLRVLKLTFVYLSEFDIDFFADNLPALEELDLSYEDYGPYSEDQTRVNVEKAVSHLHVIQMFLLASNVFDVPSDNNSAI
ncbi:hypothetical protein H0H87_008520 [Tephrocybe sp. NHM501043]|nr:hypothetical protein H0H87_008520 [Tephrocybe sp. NHM501043]